MKKLLFVLALFFALPSFAAFPATSSSTWTIRNSNGGAEYTGMPSAMAACDAVGNFYRNNYPSLTFTPSVNGNICTLTNLSAQWYLESVAGGFACPSNATLSGNTCTCNTGYVEASGSCTVPQVNNCPPAGTSAGRWTVPLVPSNGVSGTYSVCDGDTKANTAGDVCGVTIQGEFGYGNPPMVVGTAKFTGQKYSLSQCTGSGAGNASGPAAGNSQPPVAGEPAPTPCPAGYAPGTVNGTTKCYPAGTHPDPVTTETKTETKAPSVDGNSPTVSSTSKTVCDQLNCTTQTTTTTTNSDGSTSTASGTQTTTKEGYCTANPKSAQCSGTGGSSGECNGNSTIGCAELGTPSDQTLPSSDSGFSSITATPFQGSAGCPAPQNFQVLNRTYAVSFQPMCDGSATYIKPVVLILAAAAAAWIFIGGFKV